MSNRICKKMQKQNFILNGPSFAEKWNYSSVGDYLFQKMPSFGTMCALISAETGEELSYKEFFEKSLKLALSLEKLGLKVNDKIGICSENSLNYGIAFLSSVFLGTTFCLINPTYTEKEFIHVLTISKPKYIFVSKFVLERVRKIAQNVPWDLKLILFDKDSKMPNLPDLISKISDDDLRNFKLPKIDKNEHVLIISCSSGTTGLPKGVMLTDKILLSVIQAQVESSDPLIKRRTIVLGLLPMFHIYGLDTLLLSIVFNSKMVIFSKFEERDFLRNVEKYRIETLCLVPSIFVVLSKSSILNEYDLSCVKYLTCAAAVLPPKVAEAVRKRLKNPALYNCYGMTETCFAVTYSSEEHKNKSIGVLQPGCTAKIIPLDGDSKEALGPNCEGEMCFKGDLIMKGYCGDEAATKATIDGDGFLHTGDVGYYDRDGFFYIVDRIKDVIKYKGFQVPPAELEEILLTHPAIKDAAVVGLANELAGELPFAFLVKQPGINVIPAEIITYVNERVSSVKKIRGGVRFIEEIPKNPSGKILRRELRNLLNSQL